MKTESPPHPVVLQTKPGTPGATAAPIPGSLRVVRFDAHPFSLGAAAPASGELISLPLFFAGLAYFAVQKN